MGLFTTPKQTKTRYLVELPHDADECVWVMDEIVGRGPHFQTMFWWGCHVGDHRAWAFVDGQGRQEVLEWALPPVLRERALVHRLSRMDGRELRRWHEAQDDAQA